MERENPLSRLDCSGHWTVGGGSTIGLLAKNIIALHCITQTKINTVAFMLKHLCSNTHTYTEQLVNYNIMIAATVINY